MVIELNQLHKIVLDILKETLTICERYSLRYYMLGGTLLGAVRHKGFIPWDDDIDIGMPRPDYEKFIQYAQKELPEPFQINNAFMGKDEYGYYYIRVENTKTKLLRTMSIKSVVIPAFIDVFPLDGVPNDERLKKHWLKKCEYYRRLLSASQFSYFSASDSIKKKRKIIPRILRLLFKTFNLERLIDTKKAWCKLHSALTEYSYEECDTLINYCGYWGLKEMFPKSVYGEGKLYQFEDLMLRGPEDYDYVLTQMYGDYMTPPADKDKEHHYLEVVEL